jgi:surface antigen
VKKIFNFMITGSIVLFFMTLTSCDKDDVMVTTTDSVVDGSKVSGSNARVTAFAITTSYSVTPTVGTYTPNSSSSTTLPGTSGCGSFSGGVLKARVKSQSGSSFVIEIRKQDNTTFSIGGTAYVKVGSVCGSVAGQVNYSSGSSSSEITINATFTQGIVHFYPVVVSISGGTRYFAEPVMVYTLPTYTMSSVDGTVMGTVNGVEVRSSGTNSSGAINQNLNSVNQCTEFCNRYYAQVYGMNIINSGTTQGGNANAWFSNASAKGLLAYTNNGSMGPRIGDVLCLSGGGGSALGHVGIITEVSSTQVKMANQNGGTGSFYPIGWTLSRSGNTISSPSNYNVQGWLRKP